MSKCQGCGIELQDKDKNSLGYRQNKDQQICERCFKLKHYNQYQTVSLSNIEYQQIMNSIPKKSLVVYTSDILSLSQPNIKKLENVLLVITKRDILPKSVKDQKIVEYIKKRVPNLLDVIIVSSEKNYNMDKLFQLLKKYALYQEIYFVGASNSGKSTLLNKLIKDYGETKENHQITVSMYPSTTLDKVEIKLKNLTLIDTPGLIEEGNLVNILSKNDLKKVTPKKEIKPKSCQIKGKGSIVIDTFARIDYETKKASSMVIYTSNLVHIRFNSLKKDYLKELPSTTFELASGKDIVIPGLGFIKFIHPIKVTIYTKDKVIPYERDNLI